MADADPTRIMQDRIVAKLREDFAVLMDEAVLRELVRRGVDEIFFKAVEPPRDYYNREQPKQPSWFMQELTKLATPVLKAAVEVHLENSRAEIEKQISEFLSTNAMSILITKVLTERFEQLTLQLLSKLSALH